jgi:hypothetical protein
VSEEGDARSTVERTKSRRGRGRWPRRRPEEEGVVGRVGGGRLRVYSTHPHSL